MKYRVTLQEIWSQTWTVEAASKKEALAKALDGDGEEGRFEYVRMPENGANDPEEAVEEIAS